MIEKEIKGTHINESIQTLYYLSKCTLPKGTLMNGLPIGFILICFSKITV